MDRGDNAAPREERAEQRQHEGHADKREVPYLQHVLALLDHHRVQVGGHHQPRHEGGVLDRVPRPVAAPSQNLVGPARTEQIAEREKEPRKDRPAARGANPSVVELARDERAAGERERHRRADVAGVERRRMDRHPVVLQQRVEVGAVRRHRGQEIEGAGNEIQHPEKEDRDAGQHDKGPGRYFGIAPAVLEYRDRGENREQPGPEQQRALLPAPERRKLVLKSEA